MAVGREYDDALVNNDRVVPSWRGIVSGWVIVGLVVLLAGGIYVALSRLQGSYDEGVGAPLTIPRHDPGCGQGTPAAANECSGVDPALVMRYSQF